MKGYLKKLAAMGAPTDEEAKAEAGEASFAEDNPTGAGSTKCKRCSFVDEDGASVCPNCGSGSMRKTDNGKQVNHSIPEAPKEKKVKRSNCSFFAFLYNT